MTTVASSKSPPALRDVPDFCLHQGHYRARFATTLEELDAILQLRFRVFNLEMGEGLEESFATERDQDRFDRWCHHLLVEEAGTGEVIGTYRLQTSDMAEEAEGLYSAGEFRVDQLPGDVVARAAETGRACIARDHRCRRVLFLLWMGLAAYLRAFDRRYLFGCCSLSSQEPAEGVKLYRQLEAEARLHPDVRVDPLPGLECRADPVEVERLARVEVPQLFGTYLRYGARVLGPPAVDREFKTIDYFVMMDVEALDRRTYRIFFP